MKAFILALLIMLAPACAFAGTPVNLVDSNGNPITSSNPLSTVGGYAQGSTTASQIGLLNQGAVTSAQPSYTTAQTSPLSLDLFGSLRSSPYDKNGVGLDYTVPSLVQGPTAANAPNTYNPFPVSCYVAGALSAVTYSNGNSSPSTCGLKGAAWVSLTASNSSNPLLSNTANVLEVDPTGQKLTYSASITGLAAASAATDIFTIAGSGTKSIRITRITISGVATAATVADVQLIIRSAADTSGTHTTPTSVANDQGNATAATATLLAYTANPSLGATVGQIRSVKVNLGTVTGSSTPQPWTFNTPGAQEINLHGTTQVLAINLNGATITGGSFDIDIEWTEE